MKNKVVAAFLAFIVGVFGVHQFYLRQSGKGFLHLALLFAGAALDAPFLITISALIAVVAGVSYLMKPQERFDRQYNRKYMDVIRRENSRTGPTYTRHRSQRRSSSGNSVYDQQQRRTDYRRHREAQARARRSGGNYQPEQPINRPERRTGNKQPRFQKVNPHKQEGIKLFKEYDYPGAIEQFQKALEIDPSDQAVHFNLACAYSLMEDTQNALYHLDRLSATKFEHLDRIKTHDALAYLRIQPEFEQFEKNGYRLVAPAPEPEKREEVHTQKASTQPQSGLLEQLEKLASMRERGMLTNEEFEIQKRRLLG